MTETVSEFVERWWEVFPRERASTRAQYERKLRPFLRDFGAVPMDEFTRREARRWAITNRRSVPIVRALFSDAISDELVTSNPFSNLRLDRGHGRKGLTVPTEDEIRGLADGSLRLFGRYGPAFRANILFAAYVGVRPGEMFCLTWQDLDLESDEVHVRFTTGPHGATAPPKNGLERTVVLTPPAREALLTAEGGRFVEPEELVFKTPKGHRFSRTSHGRYWDQVRKAAGRPEMQFYELRHFCATHLLKLGLSPMDVAVQLGHTDNGALVMSTYGHPAEAAARGRVADAFG